MSGLRTLLVGVDAACGEVLDPLLADGDLPALGSLAGGGASGPLESQLPPWTPSAWPSLYTGTNPGKHGSFGFLEYDGYDWDVVDATTVRAPTLWELLDEQGRSSVVVNGPVTAPPPPIDGAVVPGFTAPEDPPCHPPGLLEDLRGELGEYRVYGDSEFADADRERRREEYRDLVASRGGAFRYLADRFDPEFGFLQFQQSDTAVHDFPGDRELLAAVYRAIDDEIAATIDACDPDAVIVASDHGIGPYDGYEFRANEFLRERGYLETTREGRGRPSWVPIWQEKLTDDEDGGRLDRLLSSGPAERALSLAADAVGRAGLASVARTVVPDRLLTATSVGEHVDFPASRAYLRLPVELGVRINLAGREPDGVVPRDRYEAVREELIEALAAVRTPDGDPVFDRVVPREAVLEGPFIDRAPDVMLVPAGFEQFPSARVGTDQFGPPDEPWNHKREGFIAVAGEGVDTSGGEVLGDAHLLDVAPTVLATLGVPVSDRMDGRVLPVADHPGTERYPPPGHVRNGTTGDAGSDTTMHRRLEDLGYL